MSNGTKELFKMVALVLGIIVLVVLIRNCEDKPNINNTSNSEVSNIDDEIQWAVRRYLKTYIADGESYKGKTWSDVTDLGVNHETKWRYTIRHRFASRNTTGGMLINYFRFFLSDDFQVIDYEPLGQY